MQTAIVAILIFAGLITVHEFGHFITAKLFRMYVEEFSIGMGPLIFSRQWGETRYSLRLLPVGGYVRVLGEDVEEEARKGIAPVEIPDERRYQNRPVWQRMIFAAAGAGMNLVTAVCIFTILFMLLGVPGTPDNTVSSVAEGSPAEQAGIQAGDRIVAINDVEVTLWEELSAIIAEAPAGEPLTVTVAQTAQQGNGEQTVSYFTTEIQPILSEDGSRNILGIYATVPREAVGPIRGASMGVQATGEMLVAMVDVLGDLFTGKVDVMDEEEGLTGPIGIVQIIDESTKAGWVYVLNLAAMLSINLAVLNLLPIPSLDGSKLIFLLVEAIRGKAIDPMKEGMVNLIGFSLLMMLILMVTYKDILRLLHP